MSKYILVPEAMYRGLISASNNDNTNLNVTKNNLETITKAKNLNPTSKNVLYNQTLRRFLKLNKDEREKAVKVELTNGGKMVKKSEKGVILTPSESTGDVEEQAIDGANQSVFNASPKTEDSFISVNNTPVATTNITNNADIKEENPKQKILNYIDSNQKDFSVNGDKIINSKGTAVKDSNVEKALDKILGDDVGIFTPPGTNILKSKLHQNNYTKEIISKHVVSGRYKTPKRKFQPRLWH